MSNESYQNYCDDAGVPSQRMADDCGSMANGRDGDRRSVRDRRSQGDGAVYPRGNVRISKDSNVAIPRVSSAPIEMGRGVARAQMSAARQAYEKEYREGARLLIRETCSDRPSELGKHVAILRKDGARSAMLGFVWRYLWLGSVGFLGAIAVGLNWFIAFLALALAVPICCFLVVV